MQKKKTYTVKEATLLLERYCIYQDRCHKDVEEKLWKIGMIPMAKDLILIHLIQNDFLNEERFAKSFVRGKFNQKKWGIIKITNQLRFKGVSKVNIATGLQEIDKEKYLTVLDALALKKIPLIKGKSIYEKRKKLQNYLIGKGFEFNLVMEVVFKRIV